MAIKMPPSYVEITKHETFKSSYTMYNLAHKPTKYDHPYEIIDSHVPGTPRGGFKLYYALRSFPRKHTNDRYALFFVTNNGIFVEEVSHSCMDEPINFRSIYAKYYHGFTNGDICINKPGTRLLQFIYDAEFEEIIDGKSYPNSFDFYDHPEYSDCEDHRLILSGENLDEEIEIDFCKELYKAMRIKQIYLHLRSDNYIPWEMIRPWHPGF